MIDAQEYYSIYQIVDPRDGLPFYVGLTANIEERMKQHMGCDNEIGAKYERIAEIKRLELSPLFDKIERIEGTLADARQREMYWIRCQSRAGASLLDTWHILPDYYSIRFRDLSPINP